MALSDDRNHGNRAAWTARQPLDPSLRRRIHGPIRPMESPGILHRLLGRH